MMPSAHSRERLPACKPMAEKKPYPGRSATSGKQDDAAPAALLYLPFRRLPTAPEEMLARLGEAAGLQAGDMRYKIVGRGVNHFTPPLPRPKQKRLTDEMNDLGIPAVIVDKNRLKRKIRLPLAKRVDITDDALRFFDRTGHSVLTIDKTVDLLVIIADLTGNRRKKIMFGPDIEDRASGKEAKSSFERDLQRISIGKPAAVFWRVNTDSSDAEAGMLLDPDAFHYPSMEAFMQMSAAGNFRALIRKAKKRARTCIADHGFSTTTLSRITCGPGSPRREVLACLGRYTQYMIAASEAGLVRPDGPASADFANRPGQAQPAPGRFFPAAEILPGAANAPETRPQHETAGMNAAQPSDSNAPGDADKISSKPKPPPPIQHGSWISRLLSTPWEILYALLFLAGPILSVFVQAGEPAYPGLWETATGIALAGAGIVLFPYGLVNLKYKRMVENTPTSKVRSMAMGIVEVEGRARQYYDLKTTYSRTRCIYFRCRFYRRKPVYMASRWGFFRTGGSHQEQWRLERETASGRLPFYLEDKTGRVLVRPKGAIFLVSRASQQFAGAMGMNAELLLRDDRTRIREDLIPEGARVYVLGKARPENTGDTVSEKIREELRKLKQDRARLMAYDQNENGRVDMDEWETARRDVENRVYAEMLAEGAPTERTVIGKPPYGMLPFIIADSEKAIIGKLGLRVWLFTAGGLLLFAAGIQILMSRYIL